MKKNIKKYIQLIIGISLSAFFLYLSYRKIGGLDFSKLKNCEINYFYVLISAGFFNLCIFTRALMWENVLYKKFTLMLSYRAICISMAANMVLPFRMGELVRIAVFRNGYNFKPDEDKKNFYYRVGANLIFERIMDGVVLILLTCIAVYIIDFNEEVINRVKFFRNIIILIVVASVLVIFVIKRLYTYGYCKWNWIVRIADSMKGTRMVSLPGKGFKVLLYLLICWFFSYISIILALISMGIDIKIAAPASFVLFIMTNVAILFPAAPGGIGLFEFACIYSLDLFGISGMTAGVAAVLIHLVQYIGVLPAAGLILIRYRDFVMLSKIKLSRDRI